MPDPTGGDPDAPALVLVATPIGNLGDLSTRAAAMLADATWIAAEHPEHTRRLLSSAGIPGGGRLRAVHRHNEREAAGWIIDAIRSGKTVAYVSDAGTPGISDPGGTLVEAVIDAGLPVRSIPGASAVLTALVISGLPTDRFTFEGFLPRKGPERRARLAAVATAPVTVVVYEAPTRINPTLSDLLGACGADRRAAVTRELTKRFEEVRRGSLAELAAAELPARGEYAIVIEAAPPPGDPGDAAVEAGLRRHLTDGASARDAAAAVAEELGVAKRRAYELAVRLGRD